MLFKIELGWANLLYAPLCVLFIAFYYARQETTLPIFVLLSAIPAFLAFIVNPFENIVRVMVLQLPASILLGVLVYIIYSGIRNRKQYREVLNSKATETDQLSPRVIAATSGFIFIVTALLALFKINLGWANLIYAPACGLLVALYYIKQETKLSVFLFLSAAPALLFLIIQPDSFLMFLVVSLPLCCLSGALAYVIYSGIRSIAGYHLKPSTNQLPSSRDLPDYVLPVAYTAVLIVSIYLVPTSRGPFSNVLILLLVMISPAVGLSAALIYKDKLIPYRLFAILPTAPVLSILVKGIIYETLSNIWLIELGILFMVLLIISSAVYGLYYLVKWLLMR